MRIMPLMEPTFEEENVGQIDYTSFGSFDIEEFRRIILEFKATRGIYIYI